MLVLHQHFVQGNKIQRIFCIDNDMLYSKMTNYTKNYYFSRLFLNWINRFGIPCWVSHIQWHNCRESELCSILYTTIICLCMASLVVSPAVCVIKSLSWQPISFLSTVSWLLFFSQRDHIFITSEVNFLMKNWVSSLQKMVIFLIVSNFLEMFGKIIFFSWITFHKFPISRNIWKLYLICIICYNITYKYIPIILSIYSYNAVLGMHVILNYSKFDCTNRV